MLAGPGRPKGVVDRQTRDMREAILAAAEDGYPDKLVGFYRDLRRDHIEKFSDHMLRLLPKEAHLTADVNVAHATTAALAAAFPPELIALAQLDWNAMDSAARALITDGLTALVQRATAGVIVIESQRVTDADAT